MKEGDVVIVPMPQADGAVKNRPTIVLREMPPVRDVHRAHSSPNTLCRGRSLKLVSPS